MTTNASAISVAVGATTNTPPRPRRPRHHDHRDHQVPTLRTSYWADVDLDTLLESQAKNHSYCNNQKWDYGNQYCTWFSVCEGLS